MSQAGIVDFEGSHPQVPTEFVTNMGTAVPIGNMLEILGTIVSAHAIPLQTTGSGNTVTIQAQYSSAAASSSGTNAGMASFNSTYFSVDGNGFVSLSSSGALTSLNGDSGSATPTAGAINIYGNTSPANTGLTFTGSSSALALGGTLNVSHGGTGATSFTAHSILLGQNTSAITALGAATNGQLPIGSTGADPVLATITQGAGVTITNGAGSITIAAADSVATTYTEDSGTATPAANNLNVLGSGSITSTGSGSTITYALTGLTNHNVLVGAGTSTITKVAPSATSGIPLVSNGSAADPSFTTAVVAGGGTGATTLTAHGVLLGQGTSPVTATAVGATGTVLAGNTGSDPTFQTIASLGAIVTITGNSGGAESPTAGGNFNILGTGSITVAGSANTETIQLTGLTNHSLLVGAGTATITNLGVATNGQLPIGSTGADPVLATLTQGTGISITNGAGSITVAASGSVATTYTENSGTATPSANNLNVSGTNSALTGFSPWTTGSGDTITINMPGTAKWVVNATANLGTHTTIASALTSASSGDTIFITPGTYTEDITLKAGVNICAFECDSYNPNVIILGNTTASFNGNVSISGVQLKTNGAACLTVSGSNTSNLYLNNCSINANNATAISINASNFGVRFFECTSSASGSNLIFNISSVAGVNFNRCSLSGSATGSNTISGGSVTFFNTTLGTFTVTTSSTGTINSYNSWWDSSSSNITLITMAGTGTSSISTCQFFSGTASSISIGSGCTMTISNCSLTSSNTNVITGAGSLNYGGLVFVGSSSGINVTTTTPFPFSVPQGGTGVSTFANTSSLIISGTTTTGNLQNIASVASGQVLVSAGTSTAPAWSSAPTVTSIQFGSGSALSSYVQGTSWTPGLTFGGGSTGITYTTRTGEYTRIGNIVFVSFNITLSNKGSSTGNASLTGLPISAGGTTMWINIAYPILNSLPASTSNIVINPSGTSGALYAAATNASGLSNLTDTHFSNTSQLNGTFYYFTS